MSVDELSETLLQIKVCTFFISVRPSLKRLNKLLLNLVACFLQLQAFRMQQESRAGLSFLWAHEKMEDSPRELANIQASHAETVLELQKTRNLLLLEHHISKDLQVHTHTHTHPINTFVKYMYTKLLTLILTELVFNESFRPKEELNTVNQKMESEREESSRRMAEKDKLLSKRALQINTLQGVNNNNTYFCSNSRGNNNYSHAVYH